MNGWAAASFCVDHNHCDTIVPMPKSPKPVSPTPRGVCLLAPFLGLVAAISGCANQPNRVPEKATTAAGVSRSYTPPERQLGEFATVYNCGGREMVLGRVGFMLRATLGPEQADLLPTASTGTDRFVSQTDPGTQVVIQNGGALVTWAGQALPGCRVLQHLPITLEARGFQPTWTLDVDAHGIRVHWAARGKQPAVTEAAPFSAKQTLVLGQSFALGDAVVASRVTVTHAICNDGQSDLPRPYRVEVEKDGTTHVGCGGRTLDLLQAKTWALSGSGADPRIQIHFGTDGRVWGDAGCNRFQAGYKLEADFLRIQPLSTTRKACLGAVMQTEQTFLKWLPSVTRYSMAQNGELTLFTADGQAHMLR